MDLPVKKILNKHEEECKKFNGSQAVEMPKEGEVLKFTKYEKTIYTPFVIYADLEAIVSPCASADTASHIDVVPCASADTASHIDVVPCASDEEGTSVDVALSDDDSLTNNDAADPLVIKTVKLSEHKACSYGYKVVCT